jgi:hypothetical protein
MDFHGITCKGQFITEILPEIPSASTTNQGRVIAVSGSDCFYGGGVDEWYSFILGDNDNVVNYLPKVVDDNRVSNSIISDNGYIATVHGALSTTGNVSGSGNLSITGSVTTSSTI